MLFFEFYQHHETRTSSSLTWDLCLDTSRMAFLSHHFFAGECLLPGAMMVEAMLQAGMTLLRLEQPYPLQVDRFEIRRAIQIPLHGQNAVQIKVERTDSALKGWILTDVRNAAGKIMRKDVIVACAEFSLAVAQTKPVSLNEKEGVPLTFGQQHFYAIFVRTHMELFQSLTGNLKLSHDKTFLDCEFSIFDKENHFSSDCNSLQFILSPLGFDSILQTAVTFSVLNPPDDSETYYSKLPVAIENLVLHEPFQQETFYSCQGLLQTCSATELTLKAVACDKLGKIICDVERITLKTAPFEKQNRDKIQAALATLQNTGELRS